MGYRDLSACVADLERRGQLRCVEHPIDPHLELAEVQRRLYRAGGPAVLFARPAGTAFPMLANLYGTLGRTRLLFRDTLEDMRRLVELKTDAAAFGRSPWRYRNLPAVLWRLRPKAVRDGPVLANTTSLANLPRLVCWPQDGGPFVTLPAVYTEHPDRPGWRHSNLGMYRVQLAGNDYDPAREVGLHYQIHRGIGVHHAAARRRGERLPVNVWVGGPPSLAVSAVMPLPEGLPELAFAGALGGRRLRLVRTPNGLLAPADADFVLSGHIDPTATKPEGPFGDHLGYYSLTHDFPVMTVDRVYHRPGAIWPFTVVGRPPQEDTSFGQLIHELTGSVIPTVLPGVKAVHAVDAAGVHPLLLAVGSERYVPYAGERTPQELLTQASAILGQGQLSLAKFMLIAAVEDGPPDCHDIPAFLRHVLARADWSRDLHFITRTTIDTLDYSAGEGLNAGSKLVIAAAGAARRTLAESLPERGITLPDGVHSPRVVLPGVLAVSGRPHTGRAAGEYEATFAALANSMSGDWFPLVTLVDDSAFAAASLDNWLWATFTRADPAADVLVAGGRTWRKHHGGPGPLVIDARLKPHMPPPLVEDPAVSRRVDELCARGGPLAGLGL